MNFREGCRLTPLSLPVLHKNNDLCKFLVESGAKYTGPLFTSIPSPMCMTNSLQLGEIQQLFNGDQGESDEENDLIRQLDSAFVKGRHNIHNAVAGQSEMVVNRTCSGFVTPVIGDVETCKTNNAAMSRSAAYQWVGLCPGDLHNKGYFCEATFTVRGSSGLHYILLEAMKWKKLSTEIFKKKKFQEKTQFKLGRGFEMSARLMVWLQP